MKLTEELYPGAFNTWSSSSSSGISSTNSAAAAYLRTHMHNISWYQCLRSDECWHKLRKNLESRQVLDFIAWINEKFKSTIHSLRSFDDLHDGLLLIYLLEFLYKCQLKKELHCRFKLHKIRNFETCLSFMRTSRNCPCIGIQSYDLVDCANLKIMLGFLFLIKHDYEYKFMSEVNLRIDNSLFVEKDESKTTGDKLKFEDSGLNLGLENENGAFCNDSYEADEVFYGSSSSSSSVLSLPNLEIKRDDDSSPDLGVSEITKNGCFSDFDESKDVTFDYSTNADSSASDDAICDSGPETEEKTSSAFEETISCAQHLVHEEFQISTQFVAKFVEKIQSVIVDENEYLEETVAEKKQTNACFNEYNGCVGVDDLVESFVIFEQTSETQEDATESYMQDELKNSIDGHFIDDDDTETEATENDVAVNDTDSDSDADVADDEDCSDKSDNLLNEQQLGVAENEVVSENACKLKMPLSLATHVISISALEHDICSEKPVQIDAPTVIEFQSQTGDLKSQVSQVEAIIDESEKMETSQLIEIEVIIPNEEHIEKFPSDIEHSLSLYETLAPQEYEVSAIESIVETIMEQSEIYVDSNEKKVMSDEIDKNINYAEVELNVAKRLENLDDQNNGHTIDTIDSKEAINKDLSAVSSDIDKKINKSDKSKNECKNTNFKSDEFGLIETSTKHAKKRNSETSDSETKLIKHKRLPNINNVENISNQLELKTPNKSEMSSDKIANNADNLKVISQCDQVSSLQENHSDVNNKIMETVKKVETSNEIKVEPPSLSFVANSEANGNQFKKSQTSKNSLKNNAYITEKLHDNKNAGKFEETKPVEILAESSPQNKNSNLKKENQIAEKKNTLHLNGNINSYSSVVKAELSGADATPKENHIKENGSIKKEEPNKFENKEKIITSPNLTSKNNKLISSNHINHVAQKSIESKSESNQKNTSDTNETKIGKTDKSKLLNTIRFYLKLQLIRSLF